MLNMYIAPKSGKSPLPSEDAIEAALQGLKDALVIGRPITQSEYAPGHRAGAIFHADADNHLLPAEKTFDSMTLHIGQRVEFLPRDQDVCEFEGAVCPYCGDNIPLDALKQAFEQLGLFPVDRVEYQCNSCRTDLPFREIDFGQPTGCARFWLHFEGVAFGRLSPSFLEFLSQTIGLPLVVIPEFIDDEAASWAEMRAGDMLR